MDRLESGGLYIVKDEFFSKYPNKFFLDNKHEHRPHYYAIMDSDGILWMIPLSSKVEKYRSKIEAEEVRHGVGKCLYYFIAPVSGRDSAFLIGNMFPVTLEYVRRPYEINGQPYIIQNEKIQRRIHEKAMKYLNLVNRGVLKSPMDILTMKKQLLEAQELTTV